MLATSRQCLQLTLVVLALNALVVSLVTAQRKSPPPSASRPYDLFWGLGSRTAFDPAGNSSAPGSCRRLLGPPRAKSLQRKTCRPEFLVAWVPTIKAPRYVDVRFEVKATIEASRVNGLEIQIMNLGSLRPPIDAIELVLTTKGGPTSVRLYSGTTADKLYCPGFNTFPLSASAFKNNATLLSAPVLGVRIFVNSDKVKTRQKLLSIGAVGLQVKPK